MDVIVKVSLETLFANEGQVEKTLDTAHIGIVGPGRDPYFSLASRLMMTIATAIRDQAKYELSSGDRLILSLPQTGEAIMIMDPKTLFGRLLDITYPVKGGDQTGQASD